MRPVLECERISFSYGPLRALDGASVRLVPGRVSGLLGPNASGKTTLVRLAAGLLSPERGTIRLDGRDLRFFSRSALARRVALVPQGATLPAAFTGLEIVLMGRTPHLGFLESEGPRDFAAASRALALVGAASLAERRVGELSGGERQRVLVARALAQEADVLLLDEPTVHLDPAHQVALLDLVRGFAREHGAAVLAVFHDVNLASAFCDELIFLRAGRVIAAGRPEDALTAEVLRAAYEVTFPLVRHPGTGRPAALVPGPAPASAPDATRRSEVV